MLVSMKEILDKANAENYAVAAPNVSNEINARAAIEAAEEMRAPLILDVAYRASDDMALTGLILNHLVAKSKLPIAINLDHGSSIEEVQSCIKAGFSSVMLDRSSLPDEKNISDVKEVVRFAHAVGVSVEAELGHVGSAEHYDVDRDAALTDPDKAQYFIEQTGVDCLAVAIGTAHGAYPKEFKPFLDFDRLQKIKTKTGNFPLVLHGSSGTDIEDLRRACQMGINKVNINTELCQHMAKRISNENYDGYKCVFIFKYAQEAFKERLKEMIEVYGSKNKAC